MYGLERVKVLRIQGESLRGEAKKEGRKERNDPIAKDNQDIEGSGMARCFHGLNSMNLFGIDLGTRRQTWQLDHPCLQAL